MAAVLAMLAMTMVGLSAQPALANSYLVMSSANADDGDPGDGFCSSNADTDESDCTLRAAITEANDHPGPHTIGFNAAMTIQPALPEGALPAIEEPTTIHGTTSSDCTGPLAGSIVLDGQGQAFTGLQINQNATDSVICGLVIQNWGTGVFNAGIRTDADRTQIKRNLIGTNSTGTAAAANYNGVIVDAADAQIGGDALNQINLISGNTTYGIKLFAGADGTVIEGNAIGTNLAANAALPNVSAGITIASALNVTVGGNDAGEGNLISGNTGNGIETSGTTTGTVIAGNRIGTDPAGTGAIPNGTGVRLTSPATVGGTVSAGNQTTAACDDVCNLISGNTGDGVAVNGGDDGAVSGNYIGSDINGGADLGNNMGVRLNSGATGNLIGGTSAGQRNLIVGSGSRGVYFQDTSGAVTNNTVQGNYIGLGFDGATVISNAFAGARLDGGATGNTIGGTAAGAGNAISGSSGGSGIELLDAPSNTIQGNRIGTDASGQFERGNEQHGISIDGSNGNVIGGEGAGEGNVISGNDQEGILLTSTSTSTMVEGNEIGVAADGTTALGNANSGVNIVGSNSNTVGGTTPAAGNTIAANGDDGVVLSGSATGNVIGFNSIFSNGSALDDLGIDLDGEGPTDNDPAVDLDADTGANQRQNFPVLASAQADATKTVVTGTLNSEPAHTYRIEFFSNTACDGSGNGEGETFLEAVTTAATDGAGNVGFSVELPATAVGSQITATATDLATANPDGTSEFSTCLNVSALPPPQPPAAPASSGAGSNAGTQADSRAPLAKLSGSSKQRLGKGTLVLKLTSDEAGSATASATVTVPGTSKSYKLKSVKKSVTAGKSATFKLKLSKSLRRKVTKALKRGRAVKAKAKIAVTDAAGNKASFSKTVKAKR